MISEHEFNEQMKKIQEENQARERMRLLKEEKRKGKPQRWRLSTSKTILFVVIALCIQIVAFCEYAMLVLSDASALYVLIGIPATLVPVIWGYYSKSKAENTAGGIIYDMAINQPQATGNTPINDGQVY